MEDTSKRSRIEYIDVFRGIGIILMIMGHVKFGDEFDHLIHAFNMPMFFVISGFLYRCRSNDQVTLKSVVLKKARSLLLPYLVFGIWHYLFYLLWNTIENQPVSIDLLLNLFYINTGAMPICGALWFLTALFFTDVIFFVLDRYIRSRILLALIVAVIAVVGNTACDLFPFKLPYALSAGFVGVALYYIGCLLKAYEGKKFISALMHLHWLPNTILGAITTALIFVNGYINMRRGEYSIIPLFYVNAVLSTIVILNFSRMVYPYIANGSVGRWLRRIGRNAIVYVCLNQVAVLVVTAHTNKFLHAPELVTGMLVFAVVMIALHGADRLITRTRLKIIIGR